jgi:hypothetical protein
VSDVRSPAGVQLHREIPHHHRETGEGPLPARDDQEWLEPDPGEDELVGRFGRRRRGGKRPAIPKTVNELLADLETKCIGWQRLIDVLAPDSDPTTSGLRWQDLPEDVQKRLERAGKAIDGLQEALVEHLRGSSL